jgi:16S rRNA (uracil1498-N3)-methyltransferase
MFRCTLLNDDPKKVQVRILGEFEARPKRKSRVHIALAPTKNMNRLEWFIEKCTEIGIDEITTLICENSERRVVKTERLQKIIIAAAKQSLTSTFPSVNEAVSFSTFIKIGHEMEKFIAYLNEGSSPLRAKYTPGNDVLILIGPEGDFTSREVEEALKEGFAPVTLGKGRLRTETAGVVACTTIALINED